MSQSDELMVARDLVQVRLLGAVFAGKIKDGLSLKGGLAMRILAKSERYTKDIDIAADPRVISPERVKARIGSALKQLQMAGLIDVIPAKPQKDTETTIRYKVSGRVRNTAYDLTIEVSRRDEIDPDRLQGVDCVDEKGISFIVDCFDLNSLAISKIGCLANPIREAPRDLYDLAVLISMNVRPPRHLIEKIPQEHLIALRDNLWDKIEKMDYEQATAELLRFLPKRLKKEMTEDRWLELRLKVGYEVEAWVSDVLPSPTGIEMRK